MDEQIKEFRKRIHNEHDVVCNQKYADTLPYSTHLKFAEAQGIKFRHLIDDIWIHNENNSFSAQTLLWDIVLCAIISHDAMEDARLTYNNVADLCSFMCNHKSAKMVADIVYCVTDEKGKNRAERKNSKYYKELKANELAVFVKLSDLAANTLFSKLSGSSMYKKYKNEWPNFKEETYLPKFKEFFDYVENL